MIRVTSGKAKGKKLKLPNIKDFKPTRDKYKQAVFSILGDKVHNASCLDLYAGSGGLGIEALSRGAAFCYFVDQSKSSIETIKENLLTCDLQDNAEVVHYDSVKYVANAPVNFVDIIFADPFFDNTNHKFLIQNMEEILKENGVIIFSHSADFNISEAIKNTKLNIFTQRRYGKALLTILQ